MSINPVINFRDPATVRKVGMEALMEKLGVVGTVYFMRQFTPGYGNYTEERETLLDGITNEEILADIKSRRH